MSAASSTASKVLAPSWWRARAVLVERLACEDREAGDRHLADLLNRQAQRYRLVAGVLDQRVNDPATAMTHAAVLDRAGRYEVDAEVSATLRAAARLLVDALDAPLARTQRQHRVRVATGGVR